MKSAWWPTSRTLTACPPRCFPGAGAGQERRDMQIQLGPWQRVPRDQMTEFLATATSAPGLRVYQRKVSDGHLSVLVGAEAAKNGPRWHLSISHRTNGYPPKPGRYPTWDEIKDARYRFMPGDITVAQILPPQDEYVNVAPTTFQLWQIEDADA